MGLIAIDIKMLLDPGGGFFFGVSMSESKWNVLVEEQTRYDSMTGAKSVREDIWIKPDTGDHIALICGTYGPISREERLKYANLIAAAPEMYEALEKLNAIYSDFSRETFDLVEIREIIQTALKKVTGGT